MPAGAEAECRRHFLWSPLTIAISPAGCSSYSSGRLSAEEERELFEAASANQELFNELMEAEALRSAFSTPAERERAIAILQTWEETAAPEPAYALHAQPPRAESAWMTLLRPALSSFATALAGSLSYAVIKNVGSSLGVAGPAVAAKAAQPVPSILHLVHAAIAALLLAIQFTPFLRPQAIAERDHPIARKCLAQFIAGWRWAWVAWLALYCWLWVNRIRAGGRTRWRTSSIA